MRKNQRGYIDSDLMFVLFFILLIGGLLFAALFVRFKLSNETVSGVVYNTSHNKFISDNSHFSVRASEDTYVSEENRSSYCLPPNSPYKDLITKAAQDKRIKVVVTADKYFALQAPWTCNPNVKVTEVK